MLIVLDSGRTSAVRVLDAPRIDASIEAALLLAALATKAGDRVELLVFDRRVRGRVASATGAAGDGGASRTRSPWSSRSWWRPTGRASSAQVRQRLSQRALVVLLTALDPSAVEQGLLGVAGQLTERHQVVLASVSDPEVDALRTARAGAAAVFDAAAAERVGLERAAVAVRLRQRGAEVVDALPDDLAPRLADTYIALKAAGRL